MSFPWEAGEGDTLEQDISSCCGCLTCSLLLFFLLVVAVVALFSALLGGC